MARSRNIKPGFFLNDDLADIEPLGRLLFAGLWTIADKAGRLKDSPRKIKASVLPYDDCNVDKLLNELWQKKFIIRYSVDEETYIEVLNWKKHQNPHMKEVPSEIPEPTEYKDYEPYRNEHHTSTMQEQVLHKSIPADSLNLIPDSLNLIPDSSTGASTVQKKTKVKSEVAKILFGEKVHLSEIEHQKLVDGNGEQATAQMIEILDNWYCIKGNKPNKSDYHTMVGSGWVLKRFNEDLRKQGGQAFKQNQPNRPKGFDAIDQWATMTEGMDENE